MRRCFAWGTMRGQGVVAGGGLCSPCEGAQARPRAGSGDGRPCSPCAPHAGPVHDAVLPSPVHGTSHTGAVVHPGPAPSWSTPASRTTRRRRPPGPGAVIPRKEIHNVRPSDTPYAGANATPPWAGAHLSAPPTSGAARAGREVRSTPHGIGRAEVRRIVRQRH